MSAPFRVLIADDEPHIRMPLEFLLRPLPGVTVVSVANGTEAIALAAKTNFDLVMLDVTMPQVDGYTACRRIRDAWGDKHAGQIWFLTARRSNADAELANKAGANRVLNKPVDPDRFLKLVTELRSTSSVAKNPSAA